jgi:hypothetical protein
MIFFSFLEVMIQEHWDGLDPFLCYSHTQPGHEPDLMQVKMGENFPGIDVNLHTVRVETARGFCIRI